MLKECDTLIQRRGTHMNNGAHTELHLHYRHMCSASFKPRPLFPPLVCHRSRASLSILKPSRRRATTQRRSVGRRRESSWTDVRSPEGGWGREEKVVDWHCDTAATCYNRQRRRQSVTDYLLCHHGGVFMIGDLSESRKLTQN